MSDDQENPAAALSPSKKKVRPRDRMYDYAIDRIRSLQVRQSIDGDAMLEGWKRELQVMIDIKNLIEWLDQGEMEKLAAADKKKGRRS